MYESVDLVDFLKLTHIMRCIPVSLYYMLWVACVFGSKSTDSCILIETC